MTQARQPGIIAQPRGLCTRGCVPPFGLLSIGFVVLFTLHAAATSHHTAGWTHLRRRMRLRGWFASCALLACCVVILATAPPSSTQTAPSFIGSDACRQCHEEEWASYSSGVHGHAERDSTVLGATTGCESCHGPGSLHAEAAGDRSNPGFATIRISTPRARWRCRRRAATATPRASPSTGSRAPTSAATLVRELPQHPSPAVGRRCEAPQVRRHQPPVPELPQATSGRDWRAPRTCRSARAR